MSDWYWRVIALKTAFVLTCLSSYLRADDNIQKLPFCNPHTTNEAANDDLVLVSTLDGKLSAFSTVDGVKAWDIETAPLLSSNIHHVELTSGGKWVRLVPSLSGSLYSLSGDSVERLPFDADQLLSSSFKYSDDLVIAGARETQWVGVDASTGAVRYECGALGCSGDREPAEGLLVLRRHSSTVRALDPRSGNEKWNFSVGEHQLAMSGGECGNGGHGVHEGGHGGTHEAEYSPAALPGGLLAVRQAHSHLILWQKQLEAPVAALWRLRGGSLQTVDLLRTAAGALTADTLLQATPPSLYIGTHNSQLYIQEGSVYVQRMSTAVSSSRVPFKLKHVRTPPSTDHSTALQPARPDTLALIALYGNDADKGNQGYYLYQDETCDQSVQVTDDLLGESPESRESEEHPGEEGDRTEHHHIHVHVYSLWFWWKEVLLIAVSSALLMNLMIWPRFFAPKSSLAPPSPVIYTPTYQMVMRMDDPPSKTPPSPDYSGRYENDFEPLRCLGRGGFGVVFEARNKIDHRSYAVKRITLPKRECKRERVLREVRALAQLEHEHIVRYFNAWLEHPPPTWQAARDKMWLRDLEDVSLVMTDDVTSPKPSNHTLPYRGAGDSVMLNLHKCDIGIDALDLEGQLSAKRMRSLSCNDSLSIIFDDNASKESQTKSCVKHSRDTTGQSKHMTNGDDDSFIVFANPDENGLSEARGVTVNKPLERIKECSQYSIQKSKTGNSHKKKKGHTRHWSLDMVVKTGSETSPDGGSHSNMYLYIQMQLCRRDSLHDWLRTNRTYEDRGDNAVTLFTQIVSAVEYVHLAGLIHRDLKPSNIFFAPDGKVKVGDFGLVTAMTDISQDGESPPEEFQTQTRHTYRVGTHLYMSPEQLRGLPYNYKVDIYSLGLILFELLQPFGTEAERVSCLLGVREGKYPEMFHTKYCKEMDVLKQMLSVDPSRRPTAGAVRTRVPQHIPTLVVA